MERPPEAFLCPIGLEVMRRPFVAADGHSYEEGPIRAWLRDHATSPMTNAPLPSTMVVPNHSLRAAIEAWEGQRPLELDPGCLTILSEEPLGNGSFGCVVAGLFTMHGRPRPVAVKTLPAMTRAEQRGQFARELKAHDVAQRSADRVCRLFGICDKDGRTCLVMKRYARSLADWLAAGPLAGAAVRRVGTALCRTLAQLHDAGIVVQDIKPANVLLDEHDEPVFSDFGIASVVERTTQGVRPTSVKGTFNYMAPESFEASLYGKEVDIWSMGCLIVEMATGVAPWSRLQMQQIITAVLIRKQTPEVPDGLPEAVGRCFAFDPHGRPTAAELAAALAAALAADALADEAPVRNAHTANTAEIEALRQAHAAEVQSLRDDLAAAMNVSVLANARAVAADGAVEDVTALVEAIRDTHDVKMRALRDAHAAEMEALRDAHAAAMNASMLADAATMDVSALMEAIRNEHAAEMRALRDAHAAEMRALRDAHAEEVDHLNIWGNEWLEAAEESKSRELQLSQLLNDVREEQEMALRCAQAVHEAKAQALRDRLFTVHEQCTAHKEELERLRFILAMRQARCTTPETGQAIRNAHAAEQVLRDELKTVHELCTAHEDEIERLKRSLSISERALEKENRPEAALPVQIGLNSLAGRYWSAKRGDSTAQFALANLYSTGLEGQLPRDMSKALKWWRRATNQGHAEASAALESQAAQGVFEELTEMPESIAALIQVFRAYSYVGGSSSPKYLVMKTKAGTSHTLLNPTAGIKPDSSTGGAYSPLTNFTNIGVTLRDRNGVPLSCCGNDNRSWRLNDTKWIYCLSFPALPHGIAYYVCKSCCTLLGVPR